MECLKPTKVESQKRKYIFIVIRSLSKTDTVTQTSLFGSEIVDEQEEMLGFQLHGTYQSTAATKPRYAAFLALYQ